MKRYPVNIRETLEKVVIVKANSEGEAIEKAESTWKQGKIVLTSENFMDVEYSIPEGNIEDFAKRDEMYEEVSG